MRVLASLLLVFAGVAAADATADLIGIEQQLTDALKRSDADALAALWADDLVWIGLNGKPSTKAEQLAGMRTPTSTSAPAVVDVVNKDVKVHLYGESAVVIVFSTWTTRAATGEQRASDYVATHVWSQRGGKWRLVLAHVSRVAP